MPTIEFFGYNESERDELLNSVRWLMKELAYRDDIVFVSAAPNQVVGWDGSIRPFVRILTRMPERAKEMGALLRSACDVETVIIGFERRREDTSG
jgi:hypothetical protein